MDGTIAGILMLDGLTNGAIYALLALALVLVFAVTRIIFIPQGEFVAFGALTLAGLQMGKTPLTIHFLLLMAGGQMPALWALPAGVGDVLVAATAPWIARDVHSPRGRRRAIVWNLLGMADLVVAVGPDQDLHLIGLGRCQRLADARPQGADDLVLLQRREAEQHRVRMKK